VLVHRGRLNLQNMRREMLATKELMGKLREKGVDELAQVKLATMESNGELSVVRADGKDDSGGSSRKAARVAM